MLWAEGPRSILSVSAFGVLEAQNGGLGRRRVRGCLGRSCMLWCTVLEDDELGLPLKSSLSWRWILGYSELCDGYGVEQRFDCHP